ncbi:Putative ribonuclease H protein At1g65750 [Linum perenne]
MFCGASGQLVSPEKSRVFFSKNATTAFRRRACNHLGVHETQDLGRYLGVPIIHGRITKETYGFILDRMRKKLDGWKCNTLSLAGRVTLATTVLNYIPSYAMQTSTGTTRKTHLLSWDVVCRLKTQGGLGLRKAKELNQAYLMKLGWAILKEPEKLWVRVLTNKYLNEIAEGPSLRRKNGGSALWGGGGGGGGGQVHVQVSL